MKSWLMKALCWILSLVILVNILPVRALAADLEQLIDASESENLQLEMDANASLVDVEVVGEVIENRTEFSKEYQLSNGLSLAVVYPEAVHYQKNGQWEDIDTTLTAKNGMYTTADSPWTVSFPQQLSQNNAITVEMNGHTVSFGMAGELRGSADAKLTLSNIGSENATFAVTQMQAATAQIETFDYSSEKASAKYPETIPEKLKSRLTYTNVYSNTNVVYDLTAHKLKESIVIARYDTTLQGYRYTLNTGDLVPVLNDDSSIALIDPTTKEAVLHMPAPYMIDSAGEISNDVGVSLAPNGTTYTLTYRLPTQWMADESRSWPVVLDPVVVPEYYRQNILDQFVAEDYYEDWNHGALYTGYYTAFGKMRTFLQYVNLPDLSSSDVVVNATLSLWNHGGNSADTVVEVHGVNATWDSQTITWANQPGYNSIAEDYAIVSSTGRYTWEITDLAQKWYSDENTGLMLKAPDNVETGGTNNWKKYYSVDYDVYDSNTWPYLYITFRNTNGLERYWDYTSHTAGRAGTGSVNNFSGNLVWVHNDICFGGNRMPVSISHIYNANDCGMNDYGLGYGWRTNYNQTIEAISNSNTNAAYVWTDGDGTKHYFIASSDGSGYIDEDGLELTLTVSSSGTYTITDKIGNKSNFDSKGRLTSQVNNQATASSIGITYTSSTSDRISKITDGAGRVYAFTYTDNLLSKISYKGTGSKEISYISFGYTGNKLTSITYKDGEQVQYGYSGNYLTTCTDVDGYKLKYTYSSGSPKRVVKVTEYDGSIEGGYLSIEYAHNQTTFTDHNGNKQITQFNDWGNVTSVQDGQGRAAFAQYASNKYNDTSGAKANQMKLSSKMQNTVGNRFQHNDFEDGANFTKASGSGSFTRTSGNAYNGQKSLAITNGLLLHTSALSIAVGRTETFSAYVKTSGTTARLEFYDGTNTYVSEVLPAGSDWTRLQVTYTNTGSSAASVRARIRTTGTGTTYVDSVQWEYAATASRYNLVTNGDFRNSNAWSSASGRTTLTPVAAPELSSNVYKLVGNPTSVNHITQNVTVSGNAGDTFVVAGWAKGDSAPLKDDRQFAIIGYFNYTDGTTSDGFVARFNPDTDSSVNWQYASQAMVAEQDYSSVTVEIAYNYNINTAYFDGIQLYKEEFGSSYTYDDDGNVTSVVDLQGQRTEYKYSKNNLTRIIQNGTAKMKYSYDANHNVTSARTATDVEYTFTYDAWGNNTSVSIWGVNGKITSTATYTADGNYLTSTTDALGNVTTYGYNTQTGVLEWVKYPEDTTATRTEYTYDEMYRLASTAADVSAGGTLAASYTYTDDLLTQIQTNSSTYNLAYTDFAQLSSVTVGTMLLATYTYTEDANRYLQSLDYGNGDSVEYNYDNYGRLVQETFEDGDTVAYQYDNSGALATVTDSASGIKTTYYYDFTDRLMKYTESSSSLSHSVSYQYDQQNNLTALVDTINGTTHTTSYQYNDDNRPSRSLYGQAYKTYLYDSYGRLLRRDTTHNNTVVTETFNYRNTASGTPTSQVANVQVVGGDYNITYSYTYDDNGNILSISDGTNTTSYVYDSANQLTRENNQAAGKTWIWTYDDAGNITAKKEYNYTTGTLGTALDTIEYAYGNTNWGDMLRSYDGNSVMHYVFSGNLMRDGTWTYAWEHGRELMRMTGSGKTITFEYNADGLRVSKTVDGVVHNYVYSGGKLVQETYGNTKLDFSYDAYGNPYTFTYSDGTISFVYHYVLNLQGDVVRLVTDDGITVATYAYDAWGNIIDMDYTYKAVADANPLRYRGYYYDRETGLYYLQSRYYNPKWGRFINADDIDYLGADGSLLSYNLFAYCMNNPVNRFDVNGNWSMPNWLKVTVGAVAIAGLAVATVCTGGAAAVICGAALSGAITGGASGAVMGAIGGGISGGWQGALDGACSGFMSGTLIGGATGAASAGLNIATGATTVVGNAHGSTLHKLATNMEAGKMAASGQYSQIGINKSLGKMGLNGGLTRPDVIGVGKNGVNKLVEVVSPRQRTTYISTKMSNMLSNNPGTVGKIVNWVRRLFK